MIDTLDTTISEAQHLLQQLGFVQQEAVATEKRLEAEQENHRKLMSDMDTLGKALEFTKQVIGAISTTSIRGVQDIVTLGLREIFFDRNYEFRIEVDDRGSDKTAEFFVDEVFPDGSRISVNLRDGKGGGVQSVVGFILRMYIAYHTGQRRFFALDESLSQLSSRYVPEFFEFLRFLMQSLNYDILFVSHDERFIPYGDKIYEVSDGSVKEKKSAGS